MAEAALRAQRHLQPRDPALALSSTISCRLVRSLRNLNELQGSRIDEERAFASSLFFTMVEAALRAQPHLQPRDPALALCSAGSCLSVRSLRNLNELQGSRIDEERAFASSLTFAVAEAALRAQPHLQLRDPALARRSAGSCLSVQSHCNLNELQGSRIDEERAFASSLFFTMVEAAFRAQPHLQPRDPALALCSAGSCLSVRSLRNLNELLGSRIDEERAFASSLTFAVAEAALRAQPHRKLRDPALALRSAGSCLSVRSHRNLNELQGSRIDEERAFASSLPFTMAEAALRAQPHLQPRDPALALCSAGLCTIPVRSFRNLNELQGSTIDGE